MILSVFPTDVTEKNFQKPSPRENPTLDAKTLAFPIARRPLRGRRAIFF